MFARLGLWSVVSSALRLYVFLMQEWSVIKVNKRGRRQERVLGIDLTRITNRKPVKKKQLVIDRGVRRVIDAPCFVVLLVWPAFPPQPPTHHVMMCLLVGPLQAERLISDIRLLEVAAPPHDRKFTITYLETQDPPEEVKIEYEARDKKDRGMCGGLPSCSDWLGGG